jgi:hypothetical protein
MKCAIYLHLDLMLQYHYPRSFRLINTDTDILVVNKVNQWHDKTVQSVIITNIRFEMEYENVGVQRTNLQ